MRRSGWTDQTEDGRTAGRPSAAEDIETEGLQGKLSVCKGEVRKLTGILQFSIELLKETDASAFLQVFSRSVPSKIFIKRPELEVCGKHLPYPGGMPTLSPRGILISIVDPYKA